MANKINPNPHVFIGNALSGTDMQSLLNTIHACTGLKYGYLAHEIADTGIKGFTLTLCDNGKKRIAWNRLSRVETAVTAWVMGRQLGMVSVR